MNTLKQTYIKSAIIIGALYGATSNVSAQINSTLDHNINPDSIQNIEPINPNIALDPYSTGHPVECDENNLVGENSYAGKQSTSGNGASNSVGAIRGQSNQNNQIECQY